MATSLILNNVKLIQTCFTWQLNMGSEIYRGYAFSLICEEFSQVASCHCPWSQFEGQMQGIHYFDRLYPYWFKNGDDKYSRRSLRFETNDLKHQESINFRRRNFQSSTSTTCRSSTIYYDLKLNLHNFEMGSIRGTRGTRENRTRKTA